MASAIPSASRYFALPGLPFDAVAGVVLRKTFTISSATRSNSSAGTSQSGALRLINAALLISRSGGPRRPSTSAAQAETADALADDRREIRGVLVDRATGARGTPTHRRAKRGDTGEVADRVLFLDAGVVVEQGPAQQVIDHPRHPRTREFLSAGL